MKRILCWMFGHKPPIYAPSGWWSPGEEYARVVGDYEDGIGRRHAEVHAECPRCGKIYRICRIHIPNKK